MGSAFAEMASRSTLSGWGLLAVALLFAFDKFIKQRPKMKELEIGEDEGIRAFFATQIDGLRIEIRDLREENGALRAEVRTLHGVIDGMRREALQVGISTQRAVVDSLPRDFLPESTRAALDRIEPTRDAAE